MIDKPADNGKRERHANGDQSPNPKIVKNWLEPFGDTGKRSRNDRSGKIRQHNKFINKY